MPLVTAVVDALARWWETVNADAVTTAAIALNAAVVYVVAVVVVRIGKKRWLGKNTVFDVILGFVLGSTFSRAINGGAPITATVIAGVILVSLHAAAGYVSYRWSAVGRLVKGRSDAVVEDGHRHPDRMRRHHLSERDLEEAMHLQGLTPDVSRVRWARLERSGDISIVPYPPEARVVEVDVAGGVQRVRIEIASPDGS